MKNTYIAVAVVLIVGGGLFWYLNNADTAAAPTTDAPVAENLGTYEYACDEQVVLSLTPAADLSSIMIAPAEGGAYPTAATLAAVPTASGARFEGDGVVLTAHGETVTLAEEDSAITCSPVANENEAPFNFGD